jgi:hypothetical protein
LDQRRYTFLKSWTCPMFPLSFQIVSSFLFAPTRKSSTDDSRFGFKNPPFLLRELSKDDG